MKTSLGVDKPDRARADRSSQLRDFGALGLSAIFLVFFGAAISPLLAATLILLWVALSHTPWAEIGYVRPKSWINTIAFGALGGVAFKLVLKAIIMPLLDAAPVNAPYHYLAHNPLRTIPLLFYIPIGAGIAEETLFRGYLFERLGKLLGSSIPAKGAIVLLTAGLFGIAHYQGQGIDGVKQATVVGLVFGSIFAATGKLLPLMVAHTALDLAAVFLIYFDLEDKVAHLFLK
jgi:membrane protease YdiL (CAAX protease family)